jgi:hypothetical protein
VSRRSEYVCVARLRTHRFERNRQGYNGPPRNFGKMGCGRALY